MEQGRVRTGEGLRRCPFNDESPRGRQLKLKIMKVVTSVAAMILLAPRMAGAEQASAPALTPQQLIDQVRAQQAAADTTGSASTPPQLALVPAPPAVTSNLAPAMRPTSRMPTLEDKSRLEAQLAYVNSALKIHQVTDHNTQHASEAIAARGQMLFTYSPGGIYEVQAATFHETALQLQPGELLTGKELPTAGDTARWTIAATRTGSPPNETTVLIVKPLEADLETNMTITTNRRLYTVVLKSSEHTYMPLVGWLYPQDTARELAEQAAITQKTEEQSEPLTVAPDQLNFNCTITGSQVAWRPLRAYDDGSKTYLQMSPDMQSYEAPAIFVMEGKTPTLVNYRVKHSIYIVDRLFDRAQLRVGPKTAVDISCVHRLARR
jgi:type IV secretion system protein TrbG